MAPGDTNEFRVSLTGGTTYWFNADGSSTGQGTIPDPYLRLLDKYGATQLAFDQGSGVGSNSFMSYTPTETGTFYIAAGSSSGSTGSYFLTERVADDYPTNPATPGTLAVGGSVVGTYDFVADTDWFRTALTKGITYRFVMDSTPTGPETNIQPRLKLYGPGGTTQLAADNNDRGESKASITFTPTTTGTYYVSAESFGSHVGTYRLSEDVISGVTPLAAPVSRLAFASALDVTAAPSGSANGTAALLADLGVPSISPDQFFAGALPATQPQYAAGDGDTQPSAASLAAVALNQTRDVSALPYSSAWP